MAIGKGKDVASTFDSPKAWLKASSRKSCVDIFCLALTACNLMTGQPLINT